jgi:hypothetical protein
MITPSPPRTSKFAVISECGESSPLLPAATGRGAWRTADESALEKAGASSRTPKFEELY